jgi:CO/xanthine dehydrogenase Mo-binding subunit
MSSEGSFTVGKAIPAAGSRAKAKGATRFLQDISIPGMLHAKMVLAGRPHARIAQVAFERALATDGIVAVATCDDVPGDNRVGVVIDDQPLFASRIVRYEGDCIAIVAAANPEVADLAARNVEITYEDLPCVLAIEESESSGGPAVHEHGNLAVEHNVTRGDPAVGEHQSEIVVDEVFQTAIQEHAYMETVGALAIPLTDDSIEILVPAQCPFYVRDAVARCLGVALSKVRVIQLPLGGGFGGKEDVPSEVSARLAVLAAKIQRPVRIILSREEDMICTSKRHPMQMHYRMGCDAGGRIRFADIEIKADVGAYATLSPIVLFRSTVHAGGPYEIPDIRIRTRGFYTNTVPKGAMRGFGTPQVAFACEAVIDELARRSGKDPLDFRLLNGLKQGNTTATGQVLEESVGLPDTLHRASEIVGHGHDRFKAQRVSRHLIRAKGAATMFYGVSLGAIGRTLDKGAAKVEVLKDGSVNVFIGCTDMGQGALTVISQITADALGAAIEDVTVNPVDTHIVPDSGPTVASRATVMSGNAVMDACRKIKQRMLQTASRVLGTDVVYDCAEGQVKSPERGTHLSLKQVARQCWADRVDLSATGWYVAPECSVEKETGQGKAYYVYSFATDVAEVEVDLRTGCIDLKSIVAVHDSGKIVNPLTATAQVEGGIAQAVGLAISERFAIEGGRVKSQDLSTYLIPTSLDVCDDMRVEFAECISEDGPFGAKGLGEPAIIPVAAAIANAVSNALGARVRCLPITRQWVIG